MLNYPNSPTGKTATREFYERVIAFAKANEIVVVQDAAHGMLTYDRRAEQLSGHARGEGRGRRSPFACPRAST